MLSYVLALLLLAVVLVCITLRKAYYFLPAKELKRQAEAGDQLASTFWRAVAYGPSLRLFLWLMIGFASAGAVVLLARVAPPLIGFVGVVLLLWVSFAWLPSSRLTSYGVRVSEAVTPAVVWLVGTLEPVLRTLHSNLDRRTPKHLHTGVYVREDLLDLIEKQKSQDDNRLSIEELDLASNALRFGQKKVSDIMVARKQVKTVEASESISPVYLDELHKTLHSCFPVREDKPDDFVGLLYLRDLTDVSKGKGAIGKVSDHMSKGVVYVHENDSLADTLHAFYFSKKPLFIVVNSFEEYTGIITIEDILHALLGKPGEHEFDMFESRSAVAKRHDKKPKHVDAHIDETAESEVTQPTAEPKAQPLAETPEEPDDEPKA